ncbi:hypothetical protein BJY04DRAFT_218836 [Aspergillus karnatakaensis]|uniref:uncharacterized protein n=1 Tax=Aspergillus karnatakaensis TaxID=1810916 RepID=UPI003CCCAC14
MPQNIFPSTKQAESEPSSAEDNVALKADTGPPSQTSTRSINVTSSKTPLSRKSSPKASTNAPQGPKKPAGARPPRELTDSQAHPAAVSDEIRQMQAEHVQLRKRIQELERLNDEERARNKEIAGERDKAAAQAEENWKLWKSTARELRKAKHSPGLPQVTDSQLTGLIQQLRYSIRDFAVQYFTGISRSSFSNDWFDVWESCMIPTTPGTDMYEQYIRSPSRCSSVIQGMLWRLLVSKVFGNFVWAGKAGEALCDLRYYMRYSFRHDSAADPEVERKFQMWSAEATSLVLQMCDFTEGSQEHKRIQSTRKEILEDFWAIGRQYLTTRNRSPAETLRQILDNAIALDKEIYRQAARIEWKFLPENAQVRFNPEHMEAEKGQQPPKPGQPVLLVVSPGITKKGKSDGQDFQGDEQWLVPIEVSCVPPDDIPGAAAIFGYIASLFKS